MNIETTITELRQLPLDDRRRVMRELLETLPVDDPASFFRPEDIAEFRRRVADHRADPSTAVPWSEIERSAEERRKRLSCPSE